MDHREKTDNGFRLSVETSMNLNKRPQQALPFCGSLLKLFKRHPVHAEQHFTFHSVLSSPRYHTGSLAFGSLILASVQMFKVIVEYLDRRLKSKLADLITDFCDHSGMGGGAR